MSFSKDLSASPFRLAILGLSSLLLAGSPAWAKGTANQNQKSKLPDLTKACAKICPNSKTNQEAMKCLEGIEAKSGEGAFKSLDRSCYSAHEKYEKMTGGEETHQQAAEEAGTAGHHRR